MECRNLKQIIVIGGGFSGLSAAVALAKHGRCVTLLESRKRLGGRAYSFRDEVTGDVVDNGQHLFMACYRETRRFLATIGTEERIGFQRDLRVDFRTPDARSTALKCPRLPAPYHILGGFSSLSTVSVGDIFRFRHIVSDLATRKVGDLQNITVREWLLLNRQSEDIISNFWTPLAVASLNELPHLAAAEGLAAVLRQGLMGNRADACLGLSTVGLSNLYTDAARNYIESKGGEVRLGMPVAGIDVDGGRCRGVTLKNGARLNCDAVISAVPHPALIPILPDAESLRSLRTAPIVSINVWFDRPVMSESFAGLLGTECQWAFNRSIILKSSQNQGYIAMVISAAHDHINRSQGELIRTAVTDIRRLFPEARSACPTRAFAVKEREATLSTRVGIVRPKQKSPVRNLFLAGDWTDTGLPPTIESAVFSGHRCAEMILNS